MNFLTNSKKKFKIAIDGPDGAGKSVLITKLADRLRERFARGAQFRFEPHYVSPLGDKARWDRPGIVPKERPSLREYINAIKSGEIGWPDELDNQKLLTHLFYMMNESVLRVVETRKLPANIEKEIYLFDRSFVSFAVNQKVDAWESIDRYDHCFIIVDKAETIQKNLLKRAGNDPFDDVNLDAINAQISQYKKFFNRAKGKRFSLIDLSPVPINKGDYGAKKIVSELFPD